MSQQSMVLVSDEEAKRLARKILAAQQLSQLNERSNWRGLLQWGMHLVLMGLSGYGWLAAELSWPHKLICLLIYGLSLATMFAPLHECCHRTAFANQRLNDEVAWWAGIFSFYNSTFYRRYHKWHHRFTQIPGQDPELEDPKPQNLLDYILEIIGYNWWRGKIKGHYAIARGNLSECPYISETAKPEVVRSMRLQLMVYLGAIATTTALGHPLWFVSAWVLPMVIGQPFLRFILLSEHTGCTLDANPLTNTRTTLTLWPIRLLMWNMPFHAEHHLYPSIPFHQLPQAHSQLKEHLSEIAPGYLKVNRNLVLGMRSETLQAS